MRANLPSLTALRFLAAFCIVFAHARTGLPETLGEIIGYTTLLGMPLFFVLSGFVIHYNYGHLFTDLPATALSRFAIARLARIYPLFLVMLAYALFWNGLWEVWKGANAAGILVPAYLFNAFSWFPF
jgi:peptidoglycan/LPS O-acetylase OafA/YrhL